MRSDDGSHSSADFPTTSSAYDETHNAGSDAFVVKLNAAGTGLACATFLGGANEDWGSAIAVDGQRLRDGLHRVLRLPHHGGGLRHKLRWWYMWHGT
jgi:hypothetical protein